MAENGKQNYVSAFTTEIPNVELVYDVTTSEYD